MGVTLAGIPLSDEVVIDLSKLVELEGFPDIADRLHNAVKLGTRILGLEIAEREQILRAREDCPSELAELRAVLIGEHEGRFALGL